MTIGIGICIKNEILLLADGRRLSIYKEGEPVETDDANKINRFFTSGQTSVALISFGVSEVTNLAIKILEQLLPLTNFHLGNTPQAICKIVDAAMEAAWIAIMPCFGPIIDLTRDDHITAFVIGGRVLTTPFIGLEIRNSKQSLRHECSLSPNANIVLSSAGNKARHLFDQNIASEPDLKDPLIDTLKCREAYIRIALKTISEVSINEPSIGGTIRYEVISTIPGQDCSGTCN
jgi:hypothetical protein